MEIRREGSSLFVAPSRKQSGLRIAVLADIHLPFEDPPAILLAKEILHDFQPALIILAGDIVDFYGISRFSKDPAREVNFGDEVEEDAEKLGRMLSWFSDAQWIYIEGNHEERMRAYLRMRAKVFSKLRSLEIPRLLNLPDRVLYLPHLDEPQPRNLYSAPQVCLGKLYVLHGDTVRLSGTTINVARTALQRLMVPVLMGHWHMVQVYTQTKYDGETTGAWITGCLCRPRPHYDTGRIWGQGITLIDLQRVRYNGSEDFFFNVEPIPFFSKGEHLFAIWRGREYSKKMRISDWS